MKPSYRLIDYSLRPAKFAERRMLCEAFSRLRPFCPLERYLYVGLGSIWFADHTLFHRALGIEEMISIESEKSHGPRFEFNRPYANIDIRLGTVARHLPGLDWRRRMILWLDYDDPLSLSILDDVRTVARLATSGLMFAVSVQARAFYGKSDDDEDARPEIRTVRELSLIHI